MVRRSPIALLALVAISACGHAGRAPEPVRSAREAFVHGVDSLVTLEPFRNAHWGVLVVDPERGDTLYSHNAGKLFMPASNMKIVTSTAATMLLGMDYRYVTTLAARGTVKDSVLDGDLLVYGRGDPTVSDHMLGDAMIPLRTMAESLATRGIRRITGRVALGANVFPGPTLGFGWSWDDLEGADGAGVDELLFNEGFALAHVRGGAQPGDAVTATTSPARTYPVLRVLAHTVARTDTAALRADPLRIVKDTVRGDVRVLGTIAAGDTTSLEVTFTDPDAAYLAALREALLARGIAVEDGATDTTQAVDSLFRVQSPPLRQVLAALLKPSQNQIAEMLFRTIGLVAAGTGRGDSARKVEERMLAGWGIPADGYGIRDGSGLSRYDYLTPETIAHLLDLMRRAPSFPDYYAALPIAGVDGSLRSRMRGTTAQGNVHAKTGFVSNARSLSGYVTTADGHMLIFVALCNNWTAPRRLVEDVQDSIAVRLSQLRLR